MRASLSLFALCLLPVLLSGCSAVRVGADTVKPSGRDVGTFKVGNPYQIGGQWYYPKETYSFEEMGIASWYGPGFHGKRTANGESFNTNELTAAHRTLQMPSFVRVTNLENGLSVVVRINDRGPFSKGRVIDVSQRAAELLGFKNVGTARVRLQLLPEASRQVAEAAKQGKTWRGDYPETESSLIAQASLPPAQSTAQSGSLSSPAAIRPYTVNGDPIPAHQIGGAYYPDPVVTQTEPPASTQIYIQAGSFSERTNALHLSEKLSPHGSTRIAEATVNGTVFHRVRMGPIDTVANADMLLARVGKIAPDAKIIVE